jgi:hypothetical protein
MDTAPQDPCLGAPASLVCILTQLSLVALRPVCRILVARPDVCLCTVTCWSAWVRTAAGQGAGSSWRSCMSPSCACYSMHYCLRAFASGACSKLYKLRRRLMAESIEGPAALLLARQRHRLLKHTSAKHSAEAVACMPPPPPDAPGIRQSDNTPCGSSSTKAAGFELHGRSKASILLQRHRARILYAVEREYSSESRAGAGHAAMPGHCPLNLACPERSVEPRSPGSASNVCTASPNMMW